MSSMLVEGRHHFKFCLVHDASCPSFKTCLGADSDITYSNKQNLLYSRGRKNISCPFLIMSSESKSKSGKDRGGDNGLA